MAAAHNGNGLVGVPLQMGSFNVWNAVKNLGFVVNFAHRWQPRRADWVGG